MSLDPTKGIQMKINQFKGDALEYVVKTMKENEGWSVIKLVVPKKLDDGRYIQELNPEIQKIKSAIDEKVNEIDAFEKNKQLSKSQKSTAKKYLQNTLDTIQKMDEKINNKYYWFNKNDYQNKFYQYESCLNEMINLINLADFQENINEELELRQEFLDGKLIELLFSLGIKGLPDFLCLRNGEILFIEVKADALCKTKWHQIGKFKSIINEGYSVEIIDVKVSLPNIGNSIRNAEFKKMDVNWEKISNIDSELFEKKSDINFPFEEFIKK